MRLAVGIFLLATVVIVGTSACGGAGSGFRVDPQLAATGAVRVEGDRPPQTSCADGATETAAERLTPGGRVSIGAVETVVTGVHRDVKTERLFAESVLVDLDAYFRVTHEVDRAAATASALEKVQSDGAVSGAAAALKGARGLGPLADAIEALLRMPRAETQTMVTTFASRADGDGGAVLSVCVSDHRVRAFGALDQAHFAMSCRITGEGDAAPHTLKVHAGGSWSKITYAGELIGAVDERAVFASQIFPLGAGVRGFELRHDGQIAAISFYEAGPWSAATGQETIVSRAWLSGAGSPAWRRAITQTLAIAQLYPWPNPCDAGIRQRRMAR